MRISTCPLVLTFGFRPPPKPLRKQLSYDPSLNPFADDMDNDETVSLNVPNPSLSKSSSFVSVDSQSETASGLTQGSCQQIESDTNPFADDMIDAGDNSEIIECENAEDEKTKQTCDSLSGDKDSKEESPEPSLGASKYASEPGENPKMKMATPAKSCEKKRTSSTKALAPRIPGSSDKDTE